MSTILRIARGAFSPGIARVVAIALSTVAALILPDVASASDWPVYRGTVGQDRVSAFYPGLGLGQLWAATSSPSPGSCVVASQGRVFAVVPSSIDIAQASLYAFDAGTGNVLWSTPSFPSNVPCPAVDASHVYVGEAYSVSHPPSVNAYNVSDGSSAWSTPFSGTNGGDTSGPPTVSGTAVYVTGYGGACGGANGCDFAFNAADGTLLWSVPGSSQAENPPVVSGNTVFQDERSAPGFTARAASNGSTLWSDSNADRAPVAAGSDVYYATEPAGPSIQAAVLYTRDAATGTLVWSTPLPTGAIPDGIVVDASRVIILIESYNSSISRVLAYDRTSGISLWGASESDPSGSLVGEFGNAVYTTSDVFAPASGASLGASPLGALTWAGPLGYGGAYTDGTFFTWADHGPGNDQLVALRDITPPVVTPGGPVDGAATTNTQPTFSWTATDGNGPGITQVVLLLNGTPTGGNLSSSATSYQPPAGLSDGNYTWRIQATDAVGNVTTTPAQTIAIDTTPPTVATLQQPLVDATVQSAAPTFSWGASTDATSGVDHYTLVVDGGAAATVAPSACQGGVCAVGAPHVLSDGAHTWQVQAADRAGNKATGSTDTFTVAVAPQAAITSPATALTGQPVTFNAGASSDPNSTLDDYSWDFDGSNTFFQDVGAATNVTRPFHAPGTYTVDLRVRDAAGLTAVAHATVVVRPSPPAGNVGVSINNGDYATDNPNVQLELVWPSGASQVMVSNDGGFGPVGGTATFALAPQAAWTLEQTGAERLPKTIYARFLGAGIDDVNFTDDIILDQTAPTLQSAQLVGGSGATAASVARAKPKAHSYKIKIKAHDNIVGVCAVDASAKKSGGTIVTVRSCRHKGILRLAETVTIKSTARPKYGRVRNSAGDWSRWLKLRR